MRKFTVRFILTAWLPVFFFACDSSNQPQSAQPVKPPPVSKTQSLTLAAFVDTLSKLDRKTPASITQAVELYDLLTPADSTNSDSAASALLLFVNNIVKTENEKLWKDTVDYSMLIEPLNQTLNPTQQARLSELHANKLKMVADGEGGVYLVPAYETILPTVQEKTSAPVDSMLNLVAKEDTTPVFLDAGLAIELPELADRLVMSERLLTYKLPLAFNAEARRLYAFYTRALIIGSDNSPSIEYESTTLAENFRKGYDYLLAKYPGTKVADQVKAWIAVVASGDKAGIDAYRRTLP